MSLRIVAGETCMFAAAITVFEPTGWAVWMYSSTMARRMAALRSSSMVRAMVRTGAPPATLAP